MVTKNIKDYLDQLVWEYSQACQRPRGDLYFIAAGKQCRQGKPVSDSVVKSLREKKKEDKQKSKGLSLDRKGNTAGVASEGVGTKSPKAPERDKGTPIDIFSDEGRKIMAEWLRDKEYDPKTKRIISKKKDEPKKGPGASDEPKKLTLKDLDWDPVQNRFVLKKSNKTSDKGGKPESEIDRQWKKERDLKKLLEGRNMSGWNPRATRNDGLIGLMDNPRSVQGNENRAVIQRLKDIVVSGRGSLSKSEEESLREIIVSGWGTNYQRALIEKYITGKTTMVPPRLERDYFSRGDDGSSRRDDVILPPSLSLGTKLWGDEM